MTESVLLAVVLAEPDDDAPRLILADWYDENGQSERAEFIRVQCALVAWPRCPRSHFANEYHGGRCLDCQGEMAPLRCRERELLEQYAERWNSDAGLYCEEQCETTRLGEKPMTYTGLWGWPTWHRGFVESLSCESRHFLAHADAITARHPIAEVTLATWPTLSDLIDIVAARGDLRTFYWGGSESETRAAIRALLEELWPRIKFTLPTVDGLSPLRAASRAFHIQDAIEQSRRR